MKLGFCSEKRQRVFHISLVLSVSQCTNYNICIMYVKETELNLTLQGKKKQIACFCM